jgi:cysteine desulfurase
MVGKDITECIYLDNNAATVTPLPVVREMMKWLNRGNPSADNYISNSCDQLQNEARAFIYSLLRTSARHYDIIFNSGASESNRAILDHIAGAGGKVVPHVVISAVEHASLLLHAMNLVEAGRITATYVQPNHLGFIAANDVDKAIKRSTRLVCVMHANNETGAINDVRAIGDVCSVHGVPFYSDCAQTFGKLAIRLDKYAIDGLCTSFQKTHGIGGGVLVVRKTLGLECRTGTPNIVNIAAGFAGLRIACAGRDVKNDKMDGLRIILVEGISRKIDVIALDDLPKTPPTRYVCTISLLSSNCLPSTMLLAYVNAGKTVCNTKIRKALEKAGIIVSVGSACSSDSAGASHVLTAMELPPQIRRGIIRISLGDETTTADVRKFVQEYCRIIQ